MHRRWAGLLMVRQWHHYTCRMFFFIPTGHTATQSRSPVVTLSLVALCVAGFVATSLREPALSMEDALAEVTELAGEDAATTQPSFSDRLYAAAEYRGGLERRLALVPRRGPLQVGWLTNEFVHFDLMHLLGNMLFLWLVGPLLEEAWGRGRFLVFYLGAGLFSSLVEYLINSASIASIGGASGAIAGCMGAFAIRFATTRIRFHYILWFFRIMVGSFHAPAWVAGFLWFGRELFELSQGGAAGVATGAHVGGFVLGGVVALLTKALGGDRTLLTHDEARAVTDARDRALEQAAQSARAGELEAARADLVALLQEEPTDAPALALLAEVEVLGGRGVARLEKVLRGHLAAGRKAELEATLNRVWAALNPDSLTDALAWELAQRLPPGDRADALLQSVSARSGRFAIKARERLAAKPVERPLELDELPQVFSAKLVSAGQVGLRVLVGGEERAVPFTEVRGVHAGLVGARELWIDLELRVEGRRCALRLSGRDPALGSLMPTLSTTEACRQFLVALRRAAALPQAERPWGEFTSLEQFNSSW